MSKSLVNNLIRDLAFGLSQTWNVYLFPTQCIDCSLMRVLMNLDLKDFVIITENAFFLILK